MATQTIFNGITAGATSDDIVINQDEGIVVFYQEGLAGSESVVVKQKVGSNYVAIVESGSAIVLDVDNTNQGCRGPAIIQLVASSTAGALTVESMSRSPA